MLNDQATAQASGFIVAVNAGSSSLKTVLFTNHTTPQALAVCEVEDIGLPNSLIRISMAPANGYTLKQFAIKDHAEAIEQTLAQIAPLITGGHIAAIGHRIVHGGPKHTATTSLTPTVIENLRAFSPVDPDHLPVTLTVIEHLQRRFPHTHHVACFDTDFYEDLPELARRFPLPRKYDEIGLRRYGFHGLSYQYLLESFRQHEGTTAAHGRIVMAHLGSGASLAAVKHGKPLDMTMSFSPASGIMMSTRSGDIDPGIVRFLSHATGQTFERFNSMVNHESGLLGVSGTTADMHVLLQQSGRDEHAAEAVDLFCYQVRKAIGSLSAVLGGIDSLIFAGGIGERAPVIRRAICAELGYLGIELDEGQNKQHARCISAAGSRVGVHVIHTDEALMIAKHTIASLHKHHAQAAAKGKEPSK